DLAAVARWIGPFDLPRRHGRRVKMNCVRVLAGDRSPWLQRLTRAGRPYREPVPATDAARYGRSGRPGSCPPLVLLDVARQRLAGRLDVVDHRPPRRFGIMRQDRFGDSLMLLQVLLQQPRVALVRRVARI